MATDPIRKERYLVSFYQNEVLKDRLAALGADRDAAKAAAMKFLAAEGVNCSEFVAVVGSKPYTIQLGLDHEPIEVYRVSSGVDFGVAF